MHLKYSHNEIALLIKIAIVILWLSISFKVIAQDTLTIMQYNLLYYGLNTDFCTNTNNNLAQKEQHLKKIIKHVNPSILGVNEMAASSTVANRLLTNVLNTDGVNYYQRADYTNTSGSNVVNMLYYDSRKLKYLSHVTLTSYVRDITMYKLYHNSPDLSQTHDTTYIFCVLAHLKAGNTDNDLQARKLMTQYAMGNLSTSGINQNLLFMGDLNTKTSSEDCFQNLITHSNAQIRFYDPINQLGNWYDNSYYKKYHTQSTNVSSNNCLSGGGLDDRFDFILINNAIKSNLFKMQYIQGSYTALGQDGQRFNSSVIYPTNTSVPADVANALYSASDHLPVVLKIFVDRLPAALYDYQINEDSIFSVVFNNNFLEMSLMSEKNDNIRISILSITGQLLFEKNYSVVKGFNIIKFDDFNKGKGIFLLHINNKDFTIKKTLRMLAL